MTMAATTSTTAIINPVRITRFACEGSVLRAFPTKACSTPKRRQTRDRMDPALHQTEAPARSSEPDDDAEGDLEVDRHHSQPVDLLGKTASSPGPGTRTPAPPQRSAGRRIATRHGPL